jgi:3-oxoacyl-[acyl-carrier-protein] synthase-3
MNTYSRMLGLGHYVPEHVITNADLAAIMPTSDEWIVERTGIRERRYFAEGVDTVATMSAKACRIALERAGIAVQEVDIIIMATITSEYYFPGSGVLLQRELGLPGIPAIDLKMQCSGFIYALSVADQFLRTGMYKTALVVGAEIQSNAIEHSERGRNMAVIFADGAGGGRFKSHHRSPSPHFIDAFAFRRNPCRGIVYAASGLFAKTTANRRNASRWQHVAPHERSSRI